MKKEIIIYQNKSGAIEFKGDFEKETLWASQEQIAGLFEAERSVITKHIRNIINDEELDKNSVCAKFAHTAKDGKIYTSNFYNLDMIISVGYRVNSKRGTQFRIWANKILKDYLVEGYVINERKLKEQTSRIKELEKTLDIFSKVTESYQLKQDEFAGIIKVVKDYTYALDVLDKYDNQTLTISSTNREVSFEVTYEAARKVITKMKERFGGSKLFGKEKDKSFKGIIGAIYQTFDKKELYPSIEEKAAHLLYFTIKNHSFIDGNKRIAAALFLWFLEMNKYLYSKDGMKRIPDNALVALCLLIAESDPKEKEMIARVIVNLINKRN